MRAATCEKRPLPLLRLPLVMVIYLGEEFKDRNNRVELNEPPTVL
jgi:hypothetical protein